MHVNMANILRLVQKEKVVMMSREKNAIVSYYWGKLKKGAVGRQMKKELSAGKKKREHKLSRHLVIFNYVTWSSLYGSFGRP